MGASPEASKNHDHHVEGEKRMSVYACELCGYEYRPKVGDPDNGIEEGTDFEDLPADWVCPLCGASKEDFEKVDGAFSDDNDD